MFNLLGRIARYDRTWFVCNFQHLDTTSVCLTQKQMIVTHLLRRLFELDQQVDRFWCHFSFHAAALWKQNTDQTDHGRGKQSLNTVGKEREKGGRALCLFYSWSLVSLKATAGVLWEGFGSACAALFACWFKVGPRDKRTVNIMGVKRK